MFTAFVQVSAQARSSIEDISYDDLLSGGFHLPITKGIYVYRYIIWFVLGSHGMMKVNRTVVMKQQGDQVSSATCDIPPRPLSYRLPSHAYMSHSSCNLFARPDPSSRILNCMSRVLWCLCPLSERSLTGVLAVSRMLLASLTMADPYGG